MEWFPHPVSYTHLDVYKRQEMDKALLEFLIRKLNLTKKDSIIPGGKIHNFRPVSYTHLDVYKRQV